MGSKACASVWICQWRYVSESEEVCQLGKPICGTCSDRRRRGREGGRRGEFLAAFHPIWYRTSAGTFVFLQSPPNSVAAEMMLSSPQPGWGGRIGGRKGGEVLANTQWAHAKVIETRDVLANHVWRPYTQLKKNHVVKLLNLIGQAIILPFESSCSRKLLYTISKVCLNRCFRKSWKRGRVGLHLSPNLEFCTYWPLKANSDYFDNFRRFEPILRTQKRPLGR